MIGIKPSPMKKPILLILWLFMSTIVSTGASEQSGTLGLFIKPKSCILEKNQSICEQLLLISWNMADSRPVCLYVKQRANPLKCWSDKHKSTNEFLIETEGKIVFELRDQLNGTLIYSTHYKVYKKVAKYRKKRRNPWSFY